MSLEQRQRRYIPTDLVYRLRFRLGGRAEHGPGLTGGPARARLYWVVTLGLVGAVRKDAEVCKLIGLSGDVVSDIGPDLVN